MVKVVKGRSQGQADQGAIRVALGDIESVETLNLFIALEHVRERGVEVETTELADEDLANQAVVSGQSDVGLGAPYGLIEGSSAPLRIFCQLQTLRYFPVVDKAAYPDWQALDGEPFTVHSRGSSTEALARLVEQEEGIEFGEISYVSSSEIRANALLRGNVRGHHARHPEQELRDERVARTVPHAALAGDRSERRGVLRQHRVAEAEREDGADLARGNPDRMACDRGGSLVRDGGARAARACSPTSRPSWKRRYCPTTSRPPRRACSRRTAGVVRRHEEDLEFYHTAGQIQDDPATLDVEDFWYLDPLQKAVQNVEGSGS